jgi:hypothetical protein
MSLRLALSLNTGEPAIISACAVATDCRDESRLSRNISPSVGINGVTVWAGGQVDGGLGGSRDIFSEKAQTYVESRYAFASTILAAELHQQHVYRVRFNDNPEYPLI